VCVCVCVKVCVSVCHSRELFFCPLWGALAAQPERHINLSVLVLELEVWTFGVNLVDAVVPPQVGFILYQAPLFLNGVAGHLGSQTNRAVAVHGSCEESLVEQIGGNRYQVPLVLCAPARHLGRQNNVGRYA